jgi:hypothetical protein
MADRSFDRGFRQPVTLHGLLRLVPLSAKVLALKCERSPIPVGPRVPSNNQTRRVGGWAVSR